MKQKMYSITCLRVACVWMNESVLAAEDNAEGGGGRERGARLRCCRRPGQVFSRRNKVSATKH